MTRLGELLMDAGLLSGEQLAAGLRAQVKYGGRLGTNLLEIGAIDLDTIARALGTQHAMPAALAKHFDEVDPELQDRLPAELATRFECLPLRHVFGSKHGVVLAASAPLSSQQLALIAEELLVPSEQLITAIAAEIRIKYFLERVYRVARPPRFLRVRGSIPPSTHERRGYLEDRAEQALVDAHRLARGSRENIPLVRDAAVQLPQPRPDVIPDPALADIRAAADRDQLATRVLDKVLQFAPNVAAGMLLLVREDTAIGWRSFSRGAMPVADTIVPLQFASAVAHAVSSRATVRVTRPAGGAVDQMVLHSLRGTQRELVVVPIVSEDRVWSVLACAVAPGTDATAIESAAQAAGDALDRMLAAVSHQSSSSLWT